MASNPYYYSSSHQSGYQAAEPASPTPHLPADQFISYSSYNQPQPSPFSSPPSESPLHRPYEPSTQSSITPSTRAGDEAREQEQNPFSDVIPLRQHPDKTKPEGPFPDHLPYDPAVVDAPRETRSRHQPSRKKGNAWSNVPWVVYTFTFIQCIVFIVELVKNGQLTGSPIEIHPNFNPMIGPSPYVQINMGARFVPCMRANIEGRVFGDPWPCPNSTESQIPIDQACGLNVLCGFGDQPYSVQHPPNQWYRFIVPIFLHAGFIHLGFNMLLQVFLGRDMERVIGSIRFLFVYLSSGIFGFVLGGNFAPEGIASTGASGSLFGIIAILLLDLLYHWEDRRHPWTDLMWIFVDIAISFALGLLPGLDNFSHIGGFLMGLVLGICILHSPDILRRRVGTELPPYSSVRKSRKAVEFGGVGEFVKEPVGFFKGRKPLWWVWWLVRAAALIGVLAGFAALLSNFYNINPNKCSWCKHLSCININHWCDIGKLPSLNQTTGGDSRAMMAKRTLLAGVAPF